MSSITGVSELIAERADGSNRLRRRPWDYPLTTWDDTLAAGRRLEGARDELLRLAFARLRPMVYSTALRVTRQPADAEDIVQDVFVKLHEQLDDLPVSTLPGWLKRTALLTSLNYARKRGRRAARMRKFESHVGGGAGDPPVGMSLAVCSLLDRLPHELRVVLVAKYLVGHTLEEIAESLGVSIAGASRRVRRAMTEVKQFAATRAGRP